MNSTPDKERKISVVIDLLILQTKKNIFPAFFFSLFLKKAKNVVDTTQMENMKPENMPRMNEIEKINYI